jgi:lysophospholipase L1-like esterase
MHSNPVKETKAARLKNALALAIGIGVALLLCEIVVRIADPPPKRLPALNAQIYQISTDPLIRFEYRPNYTPGSESFDESTKAFATNSSGFRDIEFTPSKSPGTQRIIALGDSITAGNGVDDPSKTYSKQLEKIMNGAGEGAKFEVFNMGVGGYNTLQEVETLRAKGLRYGPDTVVIGFCVNDFSWQASPFARMTQNLDPKQKEMLGIMQWESNAWVNTLLNRSRLAFFAYYQIQGRLGASSRTYNVNDFSVEGQDPVDMGLKILGQLQAEHGFQSYLFIIPAFDNPFSAYGYADIHQKVFGLAQKHGGIRVIDLLGDFRAIADNPEHLTFDGLHPNEAGHEAIARMIAKYLEDPSAQNTVASGTAEPLRNGSFEIVTSTDLAGWYTARRDEFSFVDAADAQDGKRVLKIDRKPGADWNILFQVLRLDREILGKTISATAFGKTPEGYQLYIALEYRAGGKPVNAMKAWPQRADAWVQNNVELTIPNDADPNTVRVSIMAKPGAVEQFQVDDVRVTITP